MNATTTTERDHRTATEITETDLAWLLARSATIVVGRARLRAEWVPMAGISGLGAGAMPKERRFVMTGPSGRHSLLVDATPIERLQAHWSGFCSDRRNRL